MNEKQGKNLQNILDNYDYIDWNWDKFNENIRKLKGQLIFNLKKTNKEIESNVLEGWHENISSFMHNFDIQIKNNKQSQYWLPKDFVESASTFKDWFLDMLTYTKLLYDFDENVDFLNEKETLRQLTLLRYFFVHPTKALLDRDAIHTLFFNKNTNINIEINNNKSILTEQEFLDLLVTTKKKVHFIVNQGWTTKSDNTVFQMMRITHGITMPWQFEIFEKENNKESFLICFTHLNIIDSFLSIFVSIIKKFNKGLRKWKPINRKVVQPKRTFPINSSKIFDLKKSNHTFKIEIEKRKIDNRIQIRYRFGQDDIWERWWNRGPQWVHKYYSKIGKMIDSFMQENERFTFINTNYNKRPTSNIDFMFYDLFAQAFNVDFGILMKKY